MIAQDVLNELHKIKEKNSHYSLMMQEYLTECYCNFLESEGITIQHIDNHYMVAYDFNGADHYILLDVFVKRMFEDHLVLMHHRMTTLKAIIEE